MPGVDQLWTVASQKVQCLIQGDIVIGLCVNSMLLELNVGVDVIGPDGMAVVGMRGDGPFGKEFLLVEGTGFV